MSAFQDPRAKKKARRWARLFVLLYLLLQLAGLRSIGLTDDDDFYIPAGISYARWLGQALRFQPGAWSRQAIDAAFQPNKEHPPLAKYVIGISHFAFSRWLGPTDSARVGVVLFSTLAAALLMWLALQHLGGRRGLRAGGVALLMMLSLPRFYFHSHAATLDVPVTAMYLAAAASVLAAERSRRASWLAGPVFGLAAATKLNAPFLLLAYLPFILLTRLGRERPVSQGGGPSIGLPNIPLALLSMAVLGPLCFLISWPWLWFEPVQRVTEYVGFHLHHYGILFLYFGRVFSEHPFAPWHAPFVMAATTIPLATSLLALFGLWKAWPVIATRIRFRDGPDDDRRKEADLLIFSALNAFTTISVVAFAGTPIYGGEKLFMPFVPFWCLLGGYGANALWERLRLELPDRTAAKLGLASALLLISGSGFALQLRFGAYALSEYNGLIGGLRGATAQGLERQYYDVAFRDLVAWLNQNAPNSAKLHFLPNNWEYVRTYRWYHEAGELRADLQVVNGEAEADLLVITHERRFARYGEDLSRYRMKPVLTEKILDGTPIWSVLKLR